MKITGLLLSVVMIVTAFGAFSLSASAAETAATGTWGEYVPDTNTYTYADFSPFNESTNGGKTGTNNNPYEISTSAQLAALAALVNRCDDNVTELTGINDSTATTSNFSGKFIKLSGDIDISGKQWIPIGIDGSQNVFSGNFDGAGYTVKGLTIGSFEFPNQELEYAGLFGYVIYNPGDLGLGRNVIENLHVSGAIYSAVNTMYGSVGGVVGYAASKSYVLDCHSSVNVSGVNNLGGVVGSNDGGTVQRCYNTGSIRSTGYCAGGVAGRNTIGSAVQYCYNTGSVSGTEQYVGGVVGYNDAGTIMNCYYLSGCAKDGYGTIQNGIGNAALGSTTANVADVTTAKTSAQFASGEVAYLLNGAFGQSLDNGETVDELPVKITATNEVYQCFGCDGTTIAYTNDAALKDKTKPHTFTETSNGFCSECAVEGVYQPATDSDGDGYYEIDNAGKLYWFAQQVNGGNNAINGKLTADIVINEGVLTEMAKNSPDPSGFRPWTPIGNGSNIYTGVFDGNGKTVSGLYFNDSAVDCVGLFSYVGTNGKVQNVGVIDSYIHGNEFLGGVVGNNSGTVDNCYNEGTVSGNNVVGGVVGFNNIGTVDNCYNEGLVSGTKDCVGGVVGFNNGGTVENCYNEGTVSGINTVGGVVGYNDGTAENCYNEGSVRGTKQYVGGVVGYITNSSSVKNCYNTGSVSGSEYVGGVVGYIYSGIAENCYYLSGCAKDGAGTIQFGIGNETQGSTTPDKVVYTSGMVADHFSSGVVAHLLGDAFGQSLDNGETVDTLPVFRTETNKVYNRLECNGTWIYSNSEKPVSHDMDVIAPEHFDANGKCLACGTQAEAKLVYITSGDPDAEEATEIYVKVEDAFDRIVSLVNGGIPGQVLQPVVTLLTDLNDTLTISGDLPHFRLNLNGYDIVSPDYVALIVEEGADVSVVNFHEENVSVIKTEASQTASIFVSGRLSLAGKTFTDTGAIKLTVGGATGIYLSENNASAGYCELFFVNFDNSVASVTFGNGKGTLHIDRDLADTIYVDRRVDENRNTDAVITVGAGCGIGSNLDKIVIVNEPDADSLVKTFDHEDISSGSKLLHDSEVIIGELSITQSDTTFTYNGNEQVPTVIVTIKTGDDTYYLNDNKHYYIEYSGDKKSAGEQGFEVVFSTDIRMNDAEAPNLTPKELTWIIKKGNADFVAPVINNTNIFYNGTEQALCDTIGSTDDGTIMYKVNDGEWLSYIETKKDAGEYDVYYKVVGDSNHNDVPETLVYTVTIKPLDFGSDSFMVEYGDNYTGKTAVYDGTPKTPNLKVGFDLDDDGTIDLELKLYYEYTDSFSTSDFTNAGEKKVHLKAEGINLTGEFDDIITITPKPVGELQISHDKPVPPVYDGESHKPTVTVKDGDKVLTEGVDYEISWDSGDFITAKLYTATITGIGNYGDTDTLDYEIVKAPIYAEIIAPEWIIPDDDITLAVKIYRTDTGEEITSEYSTYQYDFFYSINDSSGNTKQDNYSDVLNLNVDPGDAVYLWVYVRTMDGKYFEFTSDTPIELKATSTSDLLAKLENAIAGLDTDDIGVLVDRVKALETAMAEAKEAIEASEGDITALEDAYKAADKKLNELIEKLTERVTKLEEKVGATDVNNVKANADAIAEAVKAIEALEELTDLTNKDSALTKAIEALDAALDTLETKLTDALNKAVGELETKIAAQIDPDELAAEIKKVTDLIDALDSTYATDKAVEDAIAAAKQEVTDAYTAALNKAVGELEAADKSNTDALNKAVDVLKALIKAAEAYADTQDAALKAVLDEDIKKANELIAALDVRLTDAEKAIGKIEKAIEELKAVDAADAKALEDAITALNKAIEDARAFATTSDTALKNELDAKIDEADKALEGKVAEVQANLNKAVEELKTADLNNASALTEAIDTLNKAIEAAKAAATAGDETLDGKITEAESALNTKIAEVQKNLDDAKTALDKAIAEGDTKLDGKIAALSGALDAAKLTLANADAALKAELEAKIAYAEAELLEAIKKVAEDLANAKAELEQAIADGDTALDGKIADLGKALENAISAYGAADEALKAELIAKIEAADAALDGAIKTVQKNLDDAKAELGKAITDGDTALDDKIINLNKALDAAKAALEAADAADKAAMTAKIEEAYAALDEAIKAIQKDLDGIKAALEEKNGELAEKDTELEDKTDELKFLVIVACSVAGVALAGCGVLAVLVVIDRRKKLL